MGGGLGDAAWLTGARARAYALILAVILAAGASVVVQARLSASRHDPQGRPPATDFSPFYAAGRLADAGRAADCYRLPVLANAEQQAVAATTALPFLYPPPLLVLCAAVAHLPLGWAWAAFQALGLLPLLVLLRRLLPAGWAMAPLAVAPAVWMNLGSGQTGFLTAASFAGAAVWLDRQPILAGASLGLLVFKPHLALLVPVALFAARRWRAACACAAMAASLCVMSWAVFGTEVWRAFLAQTPLARDMMENWHQSFRLLVSAYGVVRMFGGDVWLGYAVQAVLALAAAAVLVWHNWRRPGGGAEVALMAAAALAATPYLMDYDLVALAVPALWLGGQAARHGWLPWEKLVLMTLYIMPLLARPAQLALGVPVALPVLLAMIWLVARRRVACRQCGARPA